MHISIPTKISSTGPREWPFIMLYLRFAHVALNQWDVIESVKSAKPITSVNRRRNGQCSATIKADHVLNREELACLLDFMSERERAA
jgi:hypothetical protein